MPELPEVETLKRQLEQVIIGKKIKSIEVLRAKSFQGNTEILINREFTSIDRIGKLMILNLTTKFPKLLIHLKMTGQLIYQPVHNAQLRNRVVGGHPTSDWVNNLPSKHTRVIVNFIDKSVLYFNDQRVFGWLKTVNNEKELEREKIGFRGLDPLSLKFDGQQLLNFLGNLKRPIKLVLLDQQKIAGLGNIYVNDALYLASINPRMQTNQLRYKEWEKLAQAIRKVLLRGIELGGASQTNYVHLDGLGGSYQNEFLVYKQDKKACQKCGTNIEKIKLGGRGTFFCPKCQKL